MPRTLLCPETGDRCEDGSCKVGYCVARVKAAPARLDAYARALQKKQETQRRRDEEARSKKLADDETAKAAAKALQDERTKAGLKRLRMLLKIR